MFRGKTLRKLRKAVGLTPNDLSMELYKSADIKISRSTLLNWESGYTEPRLSEAFIIAEYFKRPLVDFIKRI